MKIHVPRAAEWMLAASVVGLFVIGGFMVYRAVQPPPISFEAVSVENSAKAGGTLYVSATVRRADQAGCTNGVQIDARDSIGGTVRYPVPARTIRHNTSRYAIVVPSGTYPGPYWMKIRETSYCSGGPKIAETPWVPFEVVE